MSRKTFLALGVVFGFLALMLMPTMAFASSAQAASTNTSTTKASYAFAALITAGEHNGLPITGGLTLHINNAGNFSGSFHAPDSPAVAVNGQVTGSQITLSFHDADNDRVIKATGTADSSGYYNGTFNVFALAGQAAVASGTWTGLPVANPDSVFAFALHSFITQGPDKGTVFSAAVVVDKSTLTGTFSGPTNGDLANVVVVFKNGTRTIVASYDNGLFIDTGHLVEDQSGYVGTLTVTGTTDKGHWAGFFFTF